MFVKKVFCRIVFSNSFLQRKVGGKKIRLGNIHLTWIKTSSNGGGGGDFLPRRKKNDLCTQIPSVHDTSIKNFMTFVICFEFSSIWAQPQLCSYNCLEDTVIWRDRGHFYFGQELARRISVWVIETRSDKVLCSSAYQSKALELANSTTVKVGYCEIEGTEFLARYRRNSLLPTPAVEEFSLTEP